MSGSSRELAGRGGRTAQSTTSLHICNSMYMYEAPALTSYPHTDRGPDDQGNPLRREGVFTYTSIPFGTHADMRDVISLSQPHTSHRPHAPARPRATKQIGHAHGDGGVKVNDSYSTYSL